MKTFSLICVAALLVLGCSEEPVIRATDSPELTISLDRESYKPGDSIMYSFANGSESAVYLDPCPGARVEYLGDFDWSPIWQSGRECEVSYVEPKELPSGTTASVNGPTLTETGAYRITIDYWPGSLGSEVHSVYSDPFFVQ